MSSNTDPGLLLRSLEGVDWHEVYTLDTKRYAPNYLDNQSANDLPWEEFRDNCGAVYGTSIGDLEALVVPKSVTWSDRDVNIYVGSSQKEVKSFLDFTRSEFSEVFGWHVGIAVDLSGKTGESVYCTHGFNPEDTSPDAHSVRAKFHTHIHIPDTISRSIVDLDSLDRFQQLMLIEPFSGVYWDFADAYLKDSHLPEWKPSQGDGYFSLQAKLSASDRISLAKVHDLLSALTSKYEEVVDIFTDRRVEAATGYRRYIPRDPETREKLLDRFTHENGAWLSAASIDLLHYLGRNIRAATPRTHERPMEITNSGQLWTAKGFSGAINFVMSTKDDSLRFDFAPRVISTSGATKVLSDKPTIIVKSRGEASETDKERLHQFESALIDSIRNS